MALPSSGPISIGLIKDEFGSSSNSLRALSALKGELPPDAMSEFYGYQHIVFSYISGPGTGISGSGRGTSDKFQFTASNYGDGSQTDSVIRYYKSNLITVNAQISTTAEDSGFTIAQGSSATGPWSYVASGYSGANPISVQIDFFNNGRYLRYTMDIDSGSQNTLYTRTLYLWI